MVMLIIWGVRILRSKDSNFKGLKTLKMYVVSNFVVIGLSFVLFMLIVASDKISYIDYVNTLFIIPNAFGMLFFLKSNIETERVSV
jgi:L-cystine uptake protein TcyP (sodium:dicarboxylate symporter family)